MRFLLMGIVVIGMSGLLTACGGGDTEDAAPEDAGDAPAESAASDESTETAEAPEESGVQLPDGFPEGVPMLPGFSVTESEVLDAGLKQYRLLGDTEKDVDQVLDFYLAAFEGDGWEEDSVMSQPANSVCSFIKDGLLVFVNANTGGIGSIVEIITGAQD